MLDGAPPATTFANVTGVPVRRYEPIDPGRCELPVALNRAADGIRNRLIDARQRGSRRHVQMLETFPDRPRVRTRPPVELFVIERPDERISLYDELFVLMPQAVEGGGQRKGHGRRGWAAGEGRDGGVDPLAGQGAGCRLRDPGPVVKPLAQRCETGPARPPPGRERPDPGGPPQGLTPKARPSGCESQTLSFFRYSTLSLVNGIVCSTK